MSTEPIHLPDTLDGMVKYVNSLSFPATRERETVELAEDPDYGKGDV